ncbi:MAG: hypothetical protein PHV28_07425 [Kiritimatiellae bacterium]|nr:hypothetical protein [Kiritimatiellia bacterium]
MKRSLHLFAMIFLLAGCETSTVNAPSIVGVWELKEVRISKTSLFPLGAFPNRKEIYTSGGLYYETVAESTGVTGAKPKRYTYGDGIVTLFSTDGQNRTLQSKVRFVSAEVMELDTRDGDIMVYQKVSDDPATIPSVQKRSVPVKPK